MPPSVMPRPSIPVHSYAAIAYIPCSVVARAYPFFTCSPPPTFMMLPLLAHCWNGLCASTPSVLAPSAWMLPIGACDSSLGSMLACMPWLLFAFHPKRQKNRSCLSPTWTKEELSKRTSIERFFGRVFLFFHLQRPPLWGWSAIARQIALTYTASIIVGLAAQHAGRPELIRSPKRVLAHSWEAL